MEMATNLGAGGGERGAGSRKRFCGRNHSLS